MIESICIAVAVVVIVAKWLLRESSAFISTLSGQIREITISIERISCELISLKCRTFILRDLQNVTSYVGNDTATETIVTSKKETIDEFIVLMIGSLNNTY